MLTFLELYQTLLGFVFFKLYTEIGLVYPPPLDPKKQDSGAGIGAFTLEESAPNDLVSTLSLSSIGQGNDKKIISGKTVRQTIKALARSSISEEGRAADLTLHNDGNEDQDEEFSLKPSASNPGDAADLPTLHSLSSFPRASIAHLFAPYTFFLSRETSRPIFEFTVRCFGGRIGWLATSGSGSPFDETDDAITHVIIDRPLIQRADETEAERSRRQRRKYVQPQWIVDCINSGRLLLEEPYLQGKTLPPHLSPFGDREGVYDPRAGAGDGDLTADDEVAENGTVLEDEPDGDKSESEQCAGEPLAAAINAARSDPAAIRAAELQAEAAGMDYGAFEKKLGKSKAKTAQVQEQASGTDDMNKMMLSNKQRKLYEKIKYSERKRQAQVGSRGFDMIACMDADYFDREQNAKLEQRRKEIQKRGRKVVSG
jgi:pescadillo protein